MTEFINVPVPADRVLDVYQLLAEPVGAPQRNAATGAEWSQELIQRAYLESPPGMQAVFDYLAANPERIVTAKELAEGIGRTRQQLAGVLGAFGRRVKNRYLRSTWPFRAIESNEHEMVVYEMTQTLADTINQTRST